MIRVAINGFGRIGRSAFRVWLSRNDMHDQIEIAAINTSGSMDTSGWAHLVRYDSNYGVLGHEFSFESVRGPKEVSDSDPLIGYFYALGKQIPVTAQRDPEKLPWGEYHIDVVIESTGVFTTQDKAALHTKAGARRVLISAPNKGGDVMTCVLGVNAYDGHTPIADNASCTTNCISPVVKVLHESVGIQKAALNTIHGYTDDQNLQDGSHKDLRRARAAAMNTVPTSTGAAIATTRVIPDLDGKFDGVAVRVPVSVGSISDITCLTKRPTSVDEINSIFKEAAASEHWNGLLSVTEDPLVSRDIIGRQESSIVDLSLTQVIDGDLVKVMAWYDNEWGYCNRLIEQAHAVGSHE